MITKNKGNVPINPPQSTLTANELKYFSEPAIMLPFANVFGNRGKKSIKNISSLPFSAMVYAV